MGTLAENCASDSVIDQRYPSDSKILITECVAVIAYRGVCDSAVEIAH